MGKNRYEIETRGQGVVILGPENRLKSALIADLLTTQIHAVLVESFEDLASFQISYDPDQIVFLNDAESVAWLKTVDHSLFSALNQQVEEGISTFVVISHEDLSLVDLPLNTPPKIITFCDYVSEDELFAPEVSAWIESATNAHKIILSGDGLEEKSLLCLSDLARLLSRSMAQINRVNNTLKIGNPNPISSLNITYLLRTHFPYKIDISFNENSDPAGDWSLKNEVYEETLKFLGGGMLADPQSCLVKYLSAHKPTVVPKVTEKIETPVRESILPPNPVKPPVLKKLTPLRTAQPVFIPLQTKRTRLTLPHFPPKKPKPIVFPRAGVVVFRGLIIALALYLGSLAFAATISALSLKQVWSTLSSDGLPQPNSLNTFSLTYLEANWLVIAHLPGLSSNQKVKDITLLLDIYGEALSVFDSAAALGESTRDLTHYIFGSGNSDVAQIISLSRLQSEELSQKLSLLDGLLPLTPPSIIPESYRAQYVSSKAKLSKLKRTITTAKAILATTPDLIGLGGRRKYGVLFQNNMELRATGGFIGSFAIMSFENGRLYDMPIYDVYDADGQLKGHVEPPLAIKNILGEANWYLRDSNFDPDFPTSARRAEWFIKKTLNQDLDGMVAVNVNTLISLLEASGPLKVDDYGETITAGNLYERAQFHAEVNFFPGSTQKKEFLSTVANSLFSRLPSLGGEEGLKLASALSSSVEEKDTLISVINQSSDQIFQTLGWNGHVTDYPCPMPNNCHKDYTMVVDSNFGVNKANYFISRSIEEIITLEKNLSLSHTLRVAYQNNATSTAWPAGNYKNYQRVYLPVGSLISAVKVDGQQLDPKNYEITSEHGKTVIAHLINIPINSKLLVEIEYTTPQLPQENDFVYTWYWQKQSGTSSKDKVTVYLNYPLYLKPSIVSPSADLAPQQLKFDMTNDSDRRLTVKFSK